MKTPTHGPNFTQPPPDLDDGEQEWEIERIITYRKVYAKKGKWQIEYQVQQKGYEETTWEPSDNLEHAKESIKDYWIRKRQEELSIASIAPLKPDPSIKQVIYLGKDISAYDPSIPAKRIHQNIHQHVCGACSETYKHDHPYHNLFHPQFIGDCPNCKMKPLTTMVSNHAIPKE